MFETIGIGTARCGFCGTYGRCAVLYAEVKHKYDAVVACERCIRAAVKAADLLQTIRKAKEPAPKKARTRAQSRAKAPPLHPPAERVSSLVPHQEASAAAP